MSRIEKNKKSPKRILTLLAALSGVGAMLLLLLFWLYDNLETSWGNTAAQSILAVVMVAMMALFVTGMGLALLVDWMIRMRKGLFAEPQPGTRAEKLLRIFGYHLVGELTGDGRESEEIHEPDNREVVLIPEKPRRMGRHSNFTVEDWIKVALRWELRDPRFDMFSLSDVIAQELGTNADGSPIISEQSYYKKWRLEAVREINKRHLAAQPIPEKLRPRPDRKKLSE